MEKDTPKRGGLRQFPADFQTVQAIHRGAGAFVSFLQRPHPDADKLETLGACPVDELPDRLPDLLRLYPNDLYFSVNSTAAGRGAGRNGLQWTLRKKKHTRHLNAVCVDLDAYKAGMSAADALQGVCDALQIGQVPQPSMIAESGRGAYVLWLLCDPNDTEQPQRAWPETNAQHSKISRELVSLLAHLGADSAATDTARVLRVGGSINSKNGQAVQWRPMPNEQGQLARYSLDELETLLSLRYKRTGHHYGRRTQQPGSCPARRAGAIERAERRAADVEAIEAKRGGFEQGTRWTRLTAYAQLLRVTGRTREEIQTKVDAMAARCQPAFPSDESDGTTAQIVADATNPTRHAWCLSEARLVELFAVTKAEARELGLRSILPPVVRAEQQQPSQRKQAAEARQEAIRRVLSAQPDASAADVLESLTAQGINTSTATIKRDLNELFPDRPKRRAGRPTSGRTQRTATGPANARSISKGFEPIFSEPVRAPDEPGKLPLAPTGERDVIEPRPGQRLCPLRPLFPKPLTCPAAATQQEAPVVQLFAQRAEARAAPDEPE